MTSKALHPDGDFDSPAAAAAFRGRLCPKCEGFGEVYEGDDERPKRCTTCEGTGQSTRPQAGQL